MDVDFVIPLSKDDLLSGEAGSYVVDEIVSARVLPNKLRGKRTLGLQSINVNSLTHCWGSLSFIF